MLGFMRLVYPKPRCFYLRTTLEARSKDDEGDARVRDRRTCEDGLCLKTTLLSQSIDDMKKIGCTGTRIVTTLIHEMQKRSTRYGLATLFISGGMGIAFGCGEDCRMIQVRLEEWPSG